MERMLYYKAVLSPINSMLPLLNYGSRLDNGGKWYHIILFSTNFTSVFNYDLGTNRWWLYLTRRRWRPGKSLAHYARTGCRCSNYGKNIFFKIHDCIHVTLPWIIKGKLLLCCIKDKIMQKQRRCSQLNF